MIASVAPFSDADAESNEPDPLNNLYAMTVTPDLPPMVCPAPLAPGKLGRLTPTFKTSTFAWVNPDS